MAVELQLIKGNVLITLRSVLKEFYVGFDLFITQHTSDFRSVLQLTDGGQEGGKIPAVWLHSNNRLWVLFSVNGNREYGYTHNIPMKIGQWYSIAIEQVLVEEKVIIIYSKPLLF